MFLRVNPRYIKSLIFKIFRSGGIKCKHLTFQKYFWESIWGDWRPSFQKIRLRRYQMVAFNFNIPKMCLIVNIYSGWLLYEVLWQPNFQKNSPPAVIGGSGGMQHSIKCFEEMLLQSLLWPKILFRSQFPYGQPMSPVGTCVGLGATLSDLWLAHLDTFLTF